MEKKPKDHPLEKIKQVQLKSLKIKSLPEESGVYIFWLSKTPIYIGKAINIKKRIASYFAVTLSSKTAQMVNEAETVSYIKVISELESLLLESKLVKLYQPRYNIQLKDDKHPLYIRITKEELPRILTARKIEDGEDNLAFFGPFPSSANVRTVLSLLRRIFPYSQHPLGKRGCLYSQIGLCNPCPSEIKKEVNSEKRNELIKRYKNNIRMIRKILQGEITAVRKNLLKQMDINSINEDYETAKLYRDKVRQLDYITQPVTPIAAFLDNPNHVEDVREEELKEFTSFLSNYYPLKNTVRRLECYDVAHLSGTFPTASMVTFINGEADKSLYRHFKIRQQKGQNDLASMAEVAKRRKKYLALWGIPDVIIVDGGKTQTKVFKEVFSDVAIPVVGLAKRYETLVIPKNEKFVEIKLPKGGARNILQRIRNEAHRFARRYHHSLLQKYLLNEK